MNLLINIDAARTMSTSLLCSLPNITKHVLSQAAFAEKSLMPLPVNTFFC